MMVMRHFRQWAMAILLGGALLGQAAAKPKAAPADTRRAAAPKKSPAQAAPRSTPF